MSTIFGSIISFVNNMRMTPYERELRAWASENPEADTETVISRLLEAHTRTSFHDCAYEREINLRGCNLDHLPPMPETTSSYSRIDLGYNRFTRLSNHDIEILRWMNHIDLSNNDLREMPRDLFQGGRRYDRIKIYNNPLLESIPRELFALNHYQTQFSSVVISDDQRSLFGDMLESGGIDRDSRPAIALIDHHELDISWNSTSSTRRVAERSFEAAPATQYSSIRTLEENLSILCSVAGAEEFEFTGTEKEKNTLRDWLGRLNFVKTVGVTEKDIAMAKKTVEYIQLAKTNSQFRETLFSTLDEATTSCSDKMRLSLLYVDLQYRLHQIPKDQPKEAATIFRTIMALDLLFNIAVGYVQSNPGVDDVEVYLGFPVMLKEKLNLAIAVDEMNHFDCSGINDEQLDNAETIVKQSIDNKETFHKFLIDQDNWKAILETTFPNEFEAAYNSAKSTEEYESSLVKLTQKALA